MISWTASSQSFQFQSTLSMRRATHDTLHCLELRILFQSTLSMRRATQYHYGQTVNLAISIHALHEESDRPFLPIVRRLRISIHALHEESDQSVLGSMWGNLFQSTLSMRRATKQSQQAYFSRLISIRALHEESDSAACGAISTSPFQSTLSMRRATQIPPAAMQAIGISIHALHEESDCAPLIRLWKRTYFNPRSP